MTGVTVLALAFLPLLSAQELKDVRADALKAAARKSAENAPPIIPRPAPNQVGAPGGPIGEKASDAYHDALFVKIKENLLSTRPAGNGEGCTRSGAILAFINEKVEWTDPETQQKKEAKPFAMDKTGLAGAIDKMAPNVEIFFVDLPYRSECLKTPGIAVAAGITSETKSRFTAPAAGDCRRTLGEAKKDAILIFNAGGREKDASGGFITPVENIGIEGAHELLHLLLPIVKTKDAKAHHGLTQYIHYGNAAMSNSIRWSPKECEKYSQ